MDGDLLSKVDVGALTLPDADFCALLGKCDTRDMIELCDLGYLKESDMQAVIAARRAV